MNESQVRAEYKVDDQGFSFATMRYTLEEQALALMAQGWKYVDLPKDLQRALG